MVAAHLQGFAAVRLYERSWTNTDDRWLVWVGEDAVFSLWRGVSSYLYQVLM